MAARPGRVVADLPVPAPYPRDEEFRATQLYTDTCKAASTRCTEPWPPMTICEHGLQT